MVDPISIKALSGRDISVQRVAPVTPTATAAAQQPATKVAAGVTSVAQSLSASAPVDTDRVAKVKKAIADGKFPILPTTIADRLIAYKLQWRQNDQA